MAVPTDREAAGYERLRRVWFDHTRFRGRDDQGQTNKVAAKPQPRHHEFVKPTHETNLTVTLWENFSLFAASDWLPRILSAAGLPAPKSAIKRAAWSYEWIGSVAGDKRRQPMCDVVVEHEDQKGERGLLVVEAKALGKILGPKDTDNSYYMDIAEVAANADRAVLMYLVDEGCRAKVLAQLGEFSGRVGLLTWQELGAIQIELALRLDAGAAIQSFVAGAIQYQFAQHNIRPARLMAPYLEDELSMREIDGLQIGQRQAMAVHQLPMWRLPSGRL
jgi:hypothetical protein